MKILLKIVVLLICSLSGYAQSILDFKKDFKVVLDDKITNPIADGLVTKHYSLLLWFYNSNPDTKAYPLKELRNDEIYQNNITRLFADTGQKVNILACLLSASTYDTSKIADVKKVLQHSNYKNMLAAKCLLLLGEKDLDPIVKCIIAYNFNEMVQYLTFDFLNMEKNRLEKFASDSLFSPSKEMRYLAIKAMAVITPTSKNEQLLRRAVVNYETVMKGWAIAALAHYKANDMLSLVKPYINDSQLKQVSWRALAASSSDEDIKYINQMVAIKQNDPDFLNALLNSDNDNHLKNWLTLLKKD